MKCIILAAGYATRLYPLTENFPKPLLQVAGKPILDWLIDDIRKTSPISEFVLVTNSKFAPIFREWSAEGVSVVDDGTFTNDTRLGAVRDIKFAVDAQGIDEDCLIIAGDNLLDFSLGTFVDYASGKGTSCTMRYYEADAAKLRKSGVLQIDETGKVLSMQEKPAEPLSNWCCPPFYYYVKRDLALLGEALQGGCNPDAPGSFVSWLAPRRTIYSMEMPGKRYDIGTIESYESVSREFERYVAHI